MLSFVNWVIVARMDESEVLDSQLRFNRNVMIAACTLALLSTLLALWLARLFLSPIKALLGGIERLRNGERDVVVASKTRDEFHDLVGAFNGMAARIRERDDVIEGKSKAYEQLLGRMFPASVAERLRPYYRPTSLPEDMSIRWIPAQAGQESGMGLGIQRSVNGER